MATFLRSEGSAAQLAPCGCRNTDEAQTEQALREAQYRLRLEQEQFADLDSELAMERARRFSTEQEMRTMHQELVSMAQQILNERFETATLLCEAAGAEAVAEVYRERAQTAEAAARRYQEEAQALQQILSARAMTAGHPKASVRSTVPAASS